jgi:anti-anti-sigma regulatory factor
MITVRKDDKSTPPSISVAGVVDETVAFDEVFANLGLNLLLNCKDVTRINSVGIKLWRDFFQKFRQQGGTVQFLELSPPLVSTLNYLKDFVFKQEVVSFGVTFYCGNCNKSTIKVYTPETAKELLRGVDKIPCESCACSAELDEVAEEYLGFL